MSVDLYVIEMMAMQRKSELEHDANKAWQRVRNAAERKFPGFEFKLRKERTQPVVTPTACHCCP